MRYRALSAALVLVLTAASPAFASPGLPRIATVEVGGYRASIFNDSPDLRRGSNVLTVEIGSLPEGSNVSLELIGPDGQIIPVPLKPLRVVEGPDAHGGDDHGGGDGAHAEGKDAHADGEDAHADGKDAHADGEDAHADGEDAHADGEDAHAEDKDAHADGKDAQADSKAPQPATVDDHGADGHTHPPTDSTPKTETAPTAPETPAVQAEPVPAQTVPTPTPQVPTDPPVAAASTDDHGDDDHHGGAAYNVRGKVTLPATGTWTLVLSIENDHGDQFQGQTKVDVVEEGPNRAFVGMTGALMLGTISYGMVKRRQTTSGR